MAIQWTRTTLLQSGAVCTLSHLEREHAENAHAVETNTLRAVSQFANEVTGAVFGATPSAAEKRVRGLPMHRSPSDRPRPGHRPSARCVTETSPHSRGSPYNPHNQ